MSLIRDNVQQIPLEKNNVTLEYSMIVIHNFFHRTSQTWCEPSLQCLVVELLTTAPFGLENFFGSTP